ncbi:MAG: carbamoyltransferase HypF [Deltaproteobacteria bacterium]
MTSPAALLVLGVGNPSRGDDALGPMFVERASALLSREVASGAVELLTDYQLQIEHALDLEGRARVVFVDASVRAAPPFEFSRAAPRRDVSCSTHALSPEAVLATYEQIAGEPPEAWVLAIRGERFELGEPLSERAGAHLATAVAFFVAEVQGRLGSRVGRRIDVEGTVQGVGFRPWIYRVARELGLTGEVRNTPAGVSIEAFGGVFELDALVRAIQTELPAAARMRSLRATPLEARDASAFRIIASESGGATALTLAPDLATCDECLREVGDSSDRHHGYVFTSCTACGPRFAIADALPFDRAATTLRAFAPCDACAREYGRPEDRRFHAQTVACPACGPRAWIADAEGRELPSTDPVEAAARRLVDGQILGVQGVGAFHLVCDASNAAAVTELRRRKRRPAQPLAVMVRDLRAAEAVAELDEAARALLASPVRPIVLLPRRAGALASAVNGPSHRTGVMLPYTALHHRLLSSVERPLVFTSGNRSGGPAVIDRDEACQGLGELVDAFLFHDRAIARRVEDSVVTVSAGALRVLRRARGFAPAPIQLPSTAREPVLAVGGQLKNTACLVVGDLAYLTPHLGDLGLEQSQVAWQRELEGFERLLGVHAQVIAHDLHPDYASTRFALARPASRRIGVQHHAAHVFAALAELQLSEPVVGITFDGSGWGPDGTSWGAEILIVDGDRWTRANSFRALGLPGGEQAIREVWRVALAALYEAFGHDEALALTLRLRVFDGLPRASLATILRMLELGVSTVRARGMGRWFDAVGALALELPRADFEGHVAIALEDAALDGDVEPYPVTLPSAIATDEPISAAHEVDLRPTLRAAVAALLSGISSAVVAARFHQTVVEATSAVVARVLAVTGLRRVVLTGGSFQNRILEQGLRRRLGAECISMAREVPINDGGLALGQAWAAVLALGARPH